MLPFNAIRVVLLAGLAAGLAIADAAEAPVVARGAAQFDRGVIPARVQVDMARLQRHRHWRAGDPIKEIPQRKGVPRDYDPPATAQQAGGDPLRAFSQRFPASSGGRAFDSPLLNQDGMGFTGVNPPDPVGDVGNDFYVQMVNSSAGALVRILDKADGSRAVVENDQGDPVELQDFRLEDLAVGSGGNCTDGRGDPIVMFDQAAPNASGPAGRWLLSEFTSTSLCVYISQTSDPTAGGWYIYEFASDSGALPDYPKYGVWPDAYYVGANENSGSVGAPGRAVYALDRENMLLGQPTRPTQVFDAPLLAGFGFQLLHPVDWDGAMPPPPGAPGLLLRHRDDEVHNAGANDPARDFLEIWRIAIDWNDPASSTLAGPENIEVADFESEMCGLVSFSCVPQPGSPVRLDPLREPMMWRVQYRNFGTHEALVGSWVSDVVGGAADLHGVRWAELRNAGSGWTTHQQGSVSPDAVHRFMSSIAMDGAGNIAVGYNVSDAVSVYPGLRYTGRLASDPLDTMPRTEVKLVDGAGANGSNRYGDYSSLNVDPVDECTFWLTGEYNPSGLWRTRIGKFRFAACGDPTFILRAGIDRVEACTAGGDDTLDNVEIGVGSFDGFAGAVTLALQPTLPSGLSGTLTPDQVVASEPPAESLLSLTAGSGLAAGVYEVAVTGSASGVADQSVALRVDVADALPTATTLAFPDDGASGIGNRPVFEWSVVPAAAEYAFELATDASFSDIVATGIVEGNTFQLGLDLESLTEYHWRVSPINQCGAGPAATGSFTTELAPGQCAPGALETTYFADDMESGATGWTTSAADPPDTWALQSGQANSGSFAWQARSDFSVAQGEDRVSDQRLVTPAIALPAGVSSPTLEWFTDVDLEASEAGCWDAGLIEYSVDGGAWTPFTAADTLEYPYTGTVESISSSPIAGLDGWCGVQPWTRGVIDLTGLAGGTLRFRFRLGTDEAVAAGDWLIDDVQVQSCEPDFLFADGFEP